MNRGSAKLIVPALGITQILAWGSSYYLPAVLAQPIAEETGWPLTWVVGGLSIGLLVSGLASPFVGRIIHRHGGRPVLATSAVLLAAGLLGLALAPNLVTFLVAWAIIGLGMGTGLYDPAFSTLGRIYGQKARQHITTLTLFGGFASTACWPLSAYFVSEFGWRGACLAYAAIHLVVTLSIYLLALPKQPPALDELKPSSTDDTASPVRFRSVFIVMAATITLSAMISTVISVHLLTILQARDIALAAAVALGALVGPSQVGARFIEMLIARYHHPIWTKVASVVLVAVGLGLLWSHAPIITLALVFYGAGIGLESIARATVPLSIFGARDYAPIMGRLAMPSLIAQATAPTVGALLIQAFGIDIALSMVVVATIINVCLGLMLVTMTTSFRVRAAQ
ncbi:MAG TPA: MFS transporter [Dongiaceae bacterium]|nr:MFS transporter [Dongiaceae bacterium]